MDELNARMTPDLVSKLWHEYLPDVSLPADDERWHHWQRFNASTLVEALEILSQKRTMGRFEATSTPDDFGKYLSGILRNIACFAAPLTLKMGYQITEADRERFYKHIKVSEECRGFDGSPCHQWTSASTADYGRFWIAQATEYSHVVSFFLNLGNYLPQPGTLRRCGLEIHHRCRNSMCVNPQHLQLMEASFNRAMRSDPFEPIPVEDQAPGSDQELRSVTEVQYVEP